jgi:HlyD family secretion protein
MITQPTKHIQKNWRGVLLTFIAITIGMSGGITFLKWRSQQNAEVNLAETHLPPRQITVAALGRIEPASEVVEVGGLLNDRVGELMVKVGDRVQAGDILAYLDSHHERLAERNYAASQLAEAKRQLEGQTKFGQTQIQEAQSRLQQVSEPLLFEIQSQRSKIRELQAQLELAQVEVDRFQQLQQAGAVSQQELDQQQTVFRQRQEELSGAQAILAERISSWETNVQTAQAQVQSAQANLEQTRAQSQIASAAQNLELAEARLERTIIRAPRAGEILRILTHAGEMISERQGILQMGDTQQMSVIAEIYETDIRLVKVGQRSLITSRSNAFEGTLTGTVEQIGQQIFKNEVIDDDPAAKTDARVVEVRIQLDESEAVAALTNLQVDVQIQVAEADTASSSLLPSDQQVRP